MNIIGRIIGVARTGGAAGTNRDPGLYEQSRQADWLKLTGGRQVEPMHPGRQRIVSQPPAGWRKTNILYATNHQRRGAT